MKIEASLFLVLTSMCTCLTRGPHHPHGQTPVEAAHHHYKPRHAASIIADDQLLHDAKHLEEDSGVLSREAIEKMSPEELEFNYFVVHDYDKNSKLDGLELLKALYHMDHHHLPEDNSIEPEANDLDSFIALVDRTLDSDDADGDGFISYAEYRAAIPNSTDPDTAPTVEPHVNVNIT